MKNLKNIIETSFDKRFEINSQNIDPNIVYYIEKFLDLLDKGIIRISEKIDNQWITNEWVKKGILLTFCIYKNKFIKEKLFNYFDKIPFKLSNCNEEFFKKNNIRVIPSAIIRKGAYIARNTIIMPSYINIGSYIDEGTMIDTWATVGSGAQIGKYVHLSGGVGIGGVLEPIQNNPTIIEDNCFIGARSEIVEGVVVEKGSVISMGVFIGKSTKIYDRETGKIFYGKVPAGSVVVSGNLPSKNGLYSLYSAIIVKKVDIQTKNKIKLNELLRID